ncbi:hypothetical protein BASA62_005624 [Batrachochytrium salamandrivorans]|nr:hypothetical protein BASA62_005624 [Batrachochytrium salamandrivorans]
MGIYSYGVFQLRDNPITQWIEVKVDANTGVIVSKEDVKREFTYTAIKLPNESPRDGFSTIVNPENFNHLQMDGLMPGVLNLHIFTATKPNRDPALDNTILTHELTHGVSERLTGGAQTKMCMSKIESRGLSEGYSDMMALIFTAKPEDTRNTKKVMGEYVEGDSKRSQKGNIIFLQLFVGTLMIQPCNPTFESAYDAMLAADDAYYGGIHKHLIRKGFAKRGLGSYIIIGPNDGQFSMRSTLTLKLESRVGLKGVNG